MVDLIYADENLKDLGVLQEYAFDCAFGKDENSFELIMPRKEKLLDAGYFVYVENSEIGGIVDKIGVNTTDKQIIYKGRTWHGIIAERTTEPPVGEDYMILSGEANNVLGDLMEALGLDDLFVASSEKSGFEIVNFYCRYQNPMNVISQMLQGVTAKLKMVYDSAQKKVILSAVPYIDYSLDEEWSASRKDFEAEKDYLPVNHLICLGQGDLANRYTIHLFTDEAGNLQDYATEEEPFCDDDYILDKSQQLPELTGLYERVEVYDNSSAETTYNYVLTDSEPSDYKTNLEKYFTYDETEDKYDEITPTEIERYQELTQKPSDWDTNVTDYYTREGSSYKRASQSAYTVLASEPANWDVNYTSYYYYDSSEGEYKKVDAITHSAYQSISAKKAKKSFKNKQYKNLYTRHWDGTQWIYDSVSDVNYDTYKLQSKKPSNWNNNYNSYYQKKKKGKGYETVKGVKHKRSGHTVTVAPTWKKKKYYTKYSKQKAPAYDKNKTYFQEVKSYTTPSWQANRYYEEIPNYTIPAWGSTTFYMRVVDKSIPEWNIQDVYEQIEDHYANLVEGGIERLKELQDCDTISVSLRQDISYDIGDVVGATDEITGLEVWQPITKKIITITRHKKTVEYEIGGQTYGDGSSHG